MWVAGQAARLHPPTCSGLCLEADTSASPSGRMSGSACCWGSACQTPPPCSPGICTCLQSLGVAAGSWHALPPQWACPVALRGAEAAMGLELPGPGCQGRGPASPQRYGPVSSHRAWGGVCGGQAVPEKGVMLLPVADMTYFHRPVWWPLQASSSLWLARVCFIFFFMQSYAEDCWGRFFLTPLSETFCAWSCLLVGCQGGYKASYEHFKCPTSSCEAFAEPGETPRPHFFCALFLPRRCACLPGVLGSGPLLPCHHQLLHWVRHPLFWTSF